MKLNTQQISTLMQLLKTAKILGIEEIKITDGIASGLNESQTAVLFHNLDTSMPFNNMGITRISLLLSRLNLITALDSHSVELTFAPNDDTLVRNLLLKAGKTKVDFSAANVNTIRAPKSINDEMEYVCGLCQSDIELISKAAACMPQSGDDKEGEIRFSTDSDNKLKFTISDSLNDNFTSALSCKVSAIDPNQSVLLQKKYPLTTFLSATKHSNLDLVIGRKGMIKLSINDTTCYLIPRA